MRRRIFPRTFLLMLCPLLVLVMACSSQPVPPKVQLPALPSAFPTFHLPGFPTSTSTTTPAEGKVLFTYSGHKNRVTNVQWSPDSKRIASNDGSTFAIWDALTGKLAFAPLQNSITRFTWSPDGKSIACTTSNSHTIQIIDATTGKVRFVFAGDVDPSVPLAWSPDGKSIASLGFTEKVLQIWNATTGKFFTSRPGLSLGPRTLAWAPDSQRIAEADDKSIQIMSLLSDKILGRYVHAQTQGVSISWSPDGKLLAATGYTADGQSTKGGVIIWNITSNILAYTFDEYDTDTTHVQFSPDGKRLLIVGGYINPQLQIRDVATGNFIFSYTGDLNGFIQTATWSPNGKYIASSDEKNVQVWSAAPGGEVLSCLGLMSHDGNGDYGISALAYSPDGKYIVAAGSAQSSSTTQICSATDGTQLTPLSGKPTNGLAWSPDGSRIAMDQDDNVSILNARTGQQLLLYKGHQATVAKVSWSRDSESVISADIDGHIQIWNSFTGKLQTSLTDPHGALSTMALSPNGRYLVEGGSPLYVWDLSTDKIIYTYAGQKGMIYSVSWSPDSKRIASAGYDQTVRVWDATTGGHPLTYRNHHQKVFLAAWSPDGKYIVSVSDDLPHQSIQVWNASTGKTVAIYSGALSEVFALAWSPDSKAIALGGLQGQADNLVQFWRPV